MPNSIQVPFPVFFDSDGAPLDRGYVYIGVSGLNPISNPATPYLDQALTIPSINPMRTLGGYIVNNGAPVRPYVSGDYSILVTDHRGKVVFSQPVCTALESDQLLTLPRGSLSRAARVPPSFNLNLILESGFYSWFNEATSNAPVSTAAGDAFTLEVIASPDWTGIVTQYLRDVSSVDLSALGVYYRQSPDGGATWSTWQSDRSVVFGSGALGLLAPTVDTAYCLSAATTLTLPATPSIGRRLTFRNETAALTVITASAGQSIGISGVSSVTLQAKKEFIVLEWDGVNTWDIVSTQRCIVLSTSGALGALTILGDATIHLTAASTATLPATPTAGQRITFINKGAYTSTISAAAGQTIGATTSTTFVLYAAGDNVTLQWDDVSAWDIISTNGPIQSSDQSGSVTASTTNAWTAMGTGFSLGTLQPGIYDFELEASMAPDPSAGFSCATAIGKVTAPISAMVRTNGVASVPYHYPFSVHVKGYVLTSAAIIQGIYYTTGGGSSFPYSATNQKGRITARRIG